MSLYVAIAVNVPQVMGVFHYHLPPELEGRVKTGHLVVVPFGRQTVQGVVMQEVAQPEVSQTKAVIALLDEKAALTPVQIEFAQALAERTLSPLAACVGLMLPVGLAQQADTLYTLQTARPGKLTELQTRMVKLLEERGPLRGRQIDSAIPRTNWRRSIVTLVRKGLVLAQPVLPPPKVRPKMVRTARLAVPPGEAEAQMEDLGRTEATLKRRQAMLRFLIKEGEAVNVSWVYAESGGKLADLKVLAERGLVILGEEETVRDPLADLAYDPSIPPPLTSDQQAAWDVIKDGLEARAAGEAVRPYLLHGVTGSGKTEIYLRAVSETLARGKQAIVLVPEIALTPQTVRRFVARYPGQVGLVHSRLSTGERYDTWRRARAGQLSVIVGPRSALFTPLPDLGLIVVDESHDGSYYQSEGQPYYHARRAAADYAGLAGAVCVFGSATPEVGSKYQADRGKWQLLTLPDRILAHKATIRAHTERLGISSRYQSIGEQTEMTDLPPVQVVDMRQELKSGNRSIFSRALTEALTHVLKEGQQGILFLNRRGTASYVFCRDCGHSMRCPNCDSPLTYHTTLAALTCHHCGYQRKMPKTCPNCKSERIRQYGMGTERVENEIQKAFPEARTIRWDWETTRKKGAHDLILSHFANQRADLLIGTQMLAKGLDLPLVTLVGVVLADVGLNLPDYRAGERVFQTLTQVSGRAGRSPLGGQVILQTFQPEHYVIQAAAGHDYASFYRQELERRRELGYPPFARLVRLEYRHTDPQKTEREAHQMAEQIRGWLSAEERRATEMIGPAPCFFTRIARAYRWQILLRGPDPVSLLRGRKLGEWKVEVNPQALL